VSETLTVTVTQADIDQGLRYDPTHAPLSAAFSRVLRRPVGTGLRSWFYQTGSKEDVCTYYRLPPEMRDWALRFDMVGRDGVRPRSFTFEVQRISAKESMGRA
jgi:hypothetical protein